MEGGAAVRWAAVAVLAAVREALASRAAARAAGWPDWVAKAEAMVTWAALALRAARLVAVEGMQVASKAGTSRCIQTSAARTLRQCRLRERHSS